MKCISNKYATLYNSTSFLVLKFVIYFHLNLHLISSLVRPTVSLMADVPFASVGDTVTLTCTAVGGVPNTYSFTWRFNSSQIITEGVVTNGSTSVLTLTNFEFESFGSYECEVNNTFTVANNTISVLEGGE